jgi:hypothetical protein
MSLQQFIPTKKVVNVVNVFVYFFEMAIDAKKLWLGLLRLEN